MYIISIYYCILFHFTFQGAKLQGLHSTTGSVANSKQSQPIFFKSEGGVVQQKLPTTQTNSFQKVKIVRYNPNVASGQQQTLSATIVPSPLKKGIVSIAAKIIKTETTETTSIIPASTSL